MLLHSSEHYPFCLFSHPNAKNFLSPTDTTVLLKADPLHREHASTAFSDSTVGIHLLLMNSSLDSQFMIQKLKETKIRGGGVEERGQWMDGWMDMRTAWLPAWKCFMYDLSSRNGLPRVVHCFSGTLLGRMISTLPDSSCAFTRKTTYIPS